MIQKHIPERVATLTTTAKPYLKGAALVAVVLFAYVLPAIIDNALDALVLALWAAGYDAYAEVLNTAQSTLSPLASVWEFGVIAVAAVYLAKVPQLLWRQWRHLRAVALAAGALVVIPGGLSVVSSALSGEYASVAAGGYPTVAAADSPHDPHIIGVVLSDFTGFSSDLLFFLPIAALAYFYIAFEPDSFADYRDVWVATFAFSAAYELFHNVIDALVDRLLFTAIYSWTWGEFFSAVWSFSSTLFATVYMGITVLVFLRLVEYTGGEVDVADSDGFGFTTTDD